MYVKNSVSMYYHIIFNDSKFTFTCCHHFNCMLDSSIIFNQSICLHHLSNECLSLIFPCNRLISVYHFFTCTVHQKTFIQSTCLCHFIIVFSSLLTYVGILVASHRSFLSHLHLWEKWYKKD